MKEFFFFLILLPYHNFLFLFLFFTNFSIQAPSSGNFSWLTLEFIFFCWGEYWCYVGSRSGD
jgi:hypothetical protein